MGHYINEYEDWKCKKSIKLHRFLLGSLCRDNLLLLLLLRLLDQLINMTRLNLIGLLDNDVRLIDYDLFVRWAYWLNRALIIRPIWRVQKLCLSWLIYHLLVRNSHSLYIRRFLSLTLVIWVLVKRSWFIW